MNTLSHFRCVFNSLLLTTFILVQTSCGGGGGGGSEATADANAEQSEGKAPLTLIPGNSSATYTPQNELSAPAATPAPTGCTITIPSLTDANDNECQISFTCKVAALGEPAGFITACSLTIRDKSGTIFTRNSSVTDGEWFNNTYSVGDTMKNLYMLYEDTDSADGFKVEVRIDQLTVLNRTDDSSGNILRFNGNINSGKANIIMNGVTSNERFVTLGNNVEVIVEYH
ncbi:MAG: hypothetical protein Q4F35_06585 [Akkermansia sp.]|nr:hypothetical protein [Akkermansia sp.]